MFLQKQLGFKSFQDVPSAEDLPALVVLSGENGAGKSQLLEAIHTGAFYGDWDRQVPNQTRLMTTSELGNPALSPSSGETRQVLVDRFEQQANSFLRPNGGYRAPEPDGVYDNLRNAFGVSREVLEKAELRAGKRLVDWVHTDFEQWTPLEIGGDIFNFALADVFLRYSALRTTNSFNRWLESEGLEHGPWIAEEEFEGTYGPQPWQLLDAILEQLGLPYRFVPPSHDPNQASYVPRLRSTTSELELDPSQLSSGERTLLQIALSIYSGVHRAGISPLPAIILLDEPDSTLHPSMIRNLLRLVNDTLVKGLGVKVFLTTHSPTTVALAPEDSLFVMSRSAEPRMRRAASRDEALSQLLVGVPALSVALEHRRVVIVESPNDVRWYSKMLEVLAPHLGSERTLQFVAAGGKELADGCAAVVELVEKLRTNGNLSIWGLVDRDVRTSEPNDWVIFNAERYSIENVILDPLALGLLLLADGHPDVCAAVPGSSFVNFRVTDAQDLADDIMSRLRVGGPVGDQSPVEYRGGLTLSIDQELLDLRGHDYHERVTDVFPSLKQYSSHKLLDTILTRVWTQRPEYIPLSAERTFRRVLDA